MDLGGLHGLQGFQTFFQRPREHVAEGVEGQITVGGERLIGGAGTASPTADQTDLEFAAIRLAEVDGR